MAQTVRVLLDASGAARLAAIASDRARPLKQTQRARIVLLSGERLRVQDVARRAGSAARPCGAGSGATPRLASKVGCATRGVRAAAVGERRALLRRPIGGRLSLKRHQVACKKRPRHSPR